MSKETDKKTLKEHIINAGIFYLFMCQMGATMYLLLVRIPSAPKYAVVPVALGTFISAVIAWYNRR